MRAFLKSHRCAIIWSTWILIGLLSVVQVATWVIPRAMSSDYLSDGLELSFRPADPEAWSTPYWGSGFEVYVAEDASPYQNIGFGQRLLTVLVSGTFTREVDEVSSRATAKWVMESNLQILEYRPITFLPWEEQSVGSYETLSAGDWQTWSGTDGPLVAGVSSPYTDHGPGMQTVLIFAAFKVTAPSVARLINPKSSSPVESWRVTVIPSTSDSAEWVSPGGEDVLNASLGREEPPDTQAEHDGRISVTLCETCTDATTLTDILAAGGENFGEFTEIGVGKNKWAGFVRDGVIADFSRAWLPWSWVSAISNGLWVAIVAAGIGLVGTFLISRPGASFSDSTVRQAEHPKPVVVSPIAFKSRPKKSAKLARHRK